MYKIYPNYNYSFYILDFVSTCLLKEAKNVCNISSESDKNSSNIYEINGFYICTITTKLNITETGELLKAVFNLI